MKVSICTVQFEERTQVYTCNAIIYTLLKHSWTLLCSNIYLSIHLSCISFEVEAVVNQVLDKGGSRMG